MTPELELVLRTRIEVLEATIKEQGSMIELQDKVIKEIKYSGLKAGV